MLSDIVSTYDSSVQRCHQGPGVTPCSTVLRVLALFSRSSHVTRWWLQGDMLDMGLFPQVVCLFFHPGQPLIMFD